MEALYTGDGKYMVVGTKEDWQEVLRDLFSWDVTISPAAAKLVEEFELWDINR